MCDVTKSAPPAVTETVTVSEVNNCEYSATMYSIAGCPLECLTGGAMCNGHGVCGYNSDAMQSQCFCYSNWGGDKCGTGACAAARAGCSRRAARMSAALLR